MSERDLDDLLLGLRDTANPLGAIADAEARVLDRLDRTMESRPRALRAAFRSARRTMLALVAVGGVATGAAATAAIAIAMPSSSSSGPIEITADPANPEKIAFTAVQDSVQRPQGRQLALLDQLTRGAPGIRPEDARGIRASDGTQAWVVPGPIRTCFGADNADGTGYSCTANARVVRGGLHSAEVDPDGTVRAIYLVPDEIVAARAGGKTFEPHDNLVVLTYPSGSTVTFTKKSGDTTSISG